MYVSFALEMKQLRYGIWNLPMCQAKLKFCSAIISHLTAYRRDALAQETEATAGLTRLGTGHKSQTEPTHFTSDAAKCSLL
jgi:hypothetical protein